MPSDSPTTLMDHVVELRRRFFIVLGSFGVGAVIGYIARGPLIQFLEHPLGQTLYVTSPTGSFEFIMQICTLVGVLTAIPVLIYQLVRFIEPAFTASLKRSQVLGIALLSWILAGVGMTFAYCVGLPAALHFFTTVGTSHLQSLISADQYLRFLLSYLITFALAFQLPLLLLSIDNFTPLNPGGLRRWRKWVITGAFAIALVIPSAPDPLSQLILAVPLILLYESAAFAIWIRHLRRRAPKPAVLAVSAAAPTQLRPIVTPVKVPAMTARQPAVAAKPAQRGALDLRNWTMPAPVSSTHIIDLRGQA